MTRLPDDEPIVLSACLAGVACTHEAQPKTRGWALDLVATGRAVLVCPEVAGGLPIPRPAAEIQAGDGADVLDGRSRVRTQDGDDVTDAYVRGAQVARDAATRAKARLAVLKARSPSCGSGALYDGSFTGMLTQGDGVTAAALKRDGLTVIADEDVEGDT